MQISNALKHAICCQARLNIPENKDFPLLPRRFDFSIDNEILGKDHKRPSQCYKQYLGEFWTNRWGNLVFAGKCDFNEIKALRSYAFGYPQLFARRTVSCEPGLENALLIHIRSGDVMGPWIQTYYKQPPVSFYKKIIKSRDWEKVIIFTSKEKPELMNPVVSYFHDEKNREGLGSATFEFRISNSVKEHLETMWCAHNFVAASSSLSGLVVKTGPFLKNIYAVGSCQWGGEWIPDTPDVKCHRFSLPGYLEPAWHGTPEQRREMITFDIDRVKAL